MTHPIDPIRDHRIDYEVIVDCYYHGFPLIEGVK
jgi:hypothetical protein